MSVFKQLARVRVAQLRMAATRQQVGQPATALLARAREYPLATIGIAAGAGFALGSLDVHPLRVPGMASLLSGGVAGGIAHGSRWLAELATLGLAAHPADTDPGAPGDSQDELP